MASSPVLPKILSNAAVLASGPSYHGVPPPKEDVAKLNANEMNYGAHPEVLKAAEAATKSYHVYPDPAQSVLRSKIAQTHPGFSKDNVVAGSGSDDCLDVILRVIAPKRAIIPTPTFGMYAALCRLHHVKTTEIPRTEGTFYIDVEAIRKQADETSIIFLANPNNPTGTMTSLSDVETLAQTGALVVLDEAYMEFVEALNGAPSPSLSLVQKYANVVVMRTLSKWAGLAGLRVGYALAHPTIIKAMMIAKQPYNINCVAEAAAIKALEMKAELTRTGSNVHTVAAAAKELVGTLRDRYKWISPIETDANFVLCRVHGFAASSVASELAKQNVMIRFFGTQGGALERYIRISVGRPQDMERLHAALARVPETAEVVASEPSVPKVLLFDMDGVLAEVSQSYRAAIKETAASFGVTVTDADINECKSKGDANNDWVLTHRLILEKDPKNKTGYDAVVEKFQELYLGGLRDKESLIPEKALLEKITSQIPSAIVTGRPRKEAEYFLNLHGLSSCFQTIVCMEDTPRPKPDPGPVLKALKNLGASPSLTDVYMLGDTVDDIRAARAAGVTGVGVQLPNGTDKSARELISLAGADMVMSPGLAELQAWVVASDETSCVAEEIALRRCSKEQVLTKEVTLWRASENPTINGIVNGIVTDVIANGEAALIKYAVRFGDMPSADAPYIIGKEEMEKAFNRISSEHQALLQRSADRVRLFAEKQKSALQPFEMPILGGNAGHNVRAVKAAGCYAPGGRYPLPSSVLMTAIPARVAGCETVCVASPRPTDETLAAAHVAGADICLKIGGAQAIAAMAYGVGEVPECDIIVGPGNAFVTAAKKMVFGKVGIDMLAGPSEVLVLADETANARIVAADLIAQSEHDTAASSVLISTSEKLIVDVEAELKEQLSTLPTAAVAREALKRNGMCVVVDNLEDGIQCCNALAPEHLEVHTAEPKAVAARLDSYGAIFIGENCAEVTGDYASGPNHTLPTSGTARFSGGLSVLTFLCVRTFMMFDSDASARPLLEDAEKFALIEGLHGHANAAKVRLNRP